FADPTLPSPFGGTLGRFACGIKPNSGSRSDQSIGVACTATGGPFAMTRTLSQVLRVAATRHGKLMMTVLVTSATLAAVLVIGLSSRRAASLPLYARQTG